MLKAVGGCRVTGRQRSGRETPASLEAVGPGLTLHYQRCDHAKVWLCGLARLWRGRSPCPAPFNRGWKPLPQGDTLSGGLCPPYLLAKPSGTGGGVVCETKRTWSHYLLLDARRASGAFHRPSAKRQGLSERYQCCDYAALCSRSPCRHHSNATCRRESPLGPLVGTSVSCEHLLTP